MFNIRSLNKILILIKHYKIYPTEQKLIPTTALQNIHCYINKQCSTNEIEYEKYKITKLNILNTLQTILGIDDALASKLIRESKALNQTPPKLIEDNYEMCKIYKVTKESIMTNLSILSDKDLPEKLHLASMTDGNINDMMELLHMNLRELGKIVGPLQEGNSRVAFFSKLLNVHPLEMYKTIKKRPFLLRSNLEKVAESVKLLNDNGITNQEILNDLWALNYKRSTIEKRLEIAKENNLEKIKTWMIRAPSKTFLNHIKIRSDNKLILGDNSLSEYLSRHLACSIEEANFLINKLPALRGKSVKKIDEIINYLYQLNFKPIQICASPKILLHSIETMKKRVQELQQQGVHLDNLSVLIKTQKKYSVYYSKLVNSNKKKSKIVKVK